jgi:hypothetical protein
MGTKELITKRTKVIANEESLTTTCTGARAARPTWFTAVRLPAPGDVER